MSKEKLQNLTKYADNVKSKLSSQTPEKHKSHPAEYKQYLERELVATTKKIDALKLSEPAAKK